MDNNELKIRFDNVQKQIDAGKAKGENVEPLLNEKMELLQIGYKKLSEQLQEDKFEKNPKKYSTLLSYLNNIKSIQTELNKPTTETDREISKVEELMKKAGLGWLLQK